MGKRSWTLTIPQAKHAESLQMIIDAHHHLNKLYYPELNRYLDDIVRISEAYGVDRFCVSGLGEFYDGYENKDVEQAFHQLPDKVVGFAFVELDVERPDVIGQFCHRGFRGIKLISPMNNYDNEEYFPFYEQAAKYRMPILLHTGIVAPTPADAKKGVSSARMRPIFLETIARRFPELYLIGAHLGHPWFDEAVAVMRYNSNVYFDLSAMILGYIQDPVVFFKEKLVHQPDYQKLVFGTDCLIRDFSVPHEKYQFVLEKLELDVSVRQQIMGNNVERMLSSTA